MDKIEELNLWKEHLRELTPVILEQIEWMSQGAVNASVNPECPAKLIPVAERLVELQNTSGEFTRSQISREDVERIKYFSKTLKLSFDEVIKLAISNSRFVGKTAIEARGVAGYIAEIQSVYDRFYVETGEFPISEMNVEVKRACRNFKTDISIADKIEAIVEVFMPELKGLKIVKGEAKTAQSDYELTEEEFSALILYFSKKAKDGKIDACFEEENKEDFIRACKLLAKANISLEDFLQKNLNLSYSKCYSVEIIPATKQMISSYIKKNGTAKQLENIDPYLRHKIETAQRYVGQYTLRGVLTYLGISTDIEVEGRGTLISTHLEERESKLLRRLESSYPDHKIDKAFIADNPKLYEESKFLAIRLGSGDIDDYLQTRGFTRERGHKKQTEHVFYLSERDLLFYEFDKMNLQDFEACAVTELSPADYFGTYCKLVAQGLDGFGTASHKTKTFGG